MSRKTALQVLKAVVSVGLLVVLVVRIGPDAIGRVLAAVRPAHLIVPALLILADQALRIVAWRILLGARGYRPGLLGIAHGYVAGTFIGALLPSSLGTDAARAVAIARTTGVPVTQAAGSVLVLSLFGLFAICGLTVVSGLVLIARGSALAVTNLAMLFALAYIAVMALLAQGGLPRTVLAALGGHRLTRPVARLLEKWYAALHAYTSLRVLRPVVGIAFANQLIGIAWNYAAAVALGLDIPFIYFALFIPVIMVGKLVPLTIMGFGVEQGYFAYLFSRVGVASAQAVALSLLIATINMLYSFSCGLAVVGGSFGRLLLPAAAAAAPSLRHAEDDR